ncbi:tRNA lysidine(34) synthetase TilS [Litorivicinus lipolyticus]|uniref:tRNA(Ile)-lysidine synthase n=1 Tax=Litorivicinus lipolyticus TaxID=418701 RepID=A0A5Q2QG43_9GAMM|nr:tRNA lysidine(34) synthetase TilS [Litorivicinus lipolyticus]QGG79975.1 tRNA lysidine(34) synthetase TilS [Litorivicinus lipolyticus]
MPSPNQGRWWVAFSGGPDSHALLQWALARHSDVALVHVNHGWHAQAGAWADACQAQADRLGIHAQLLKLDSTTPKTEAAARVGRYALMQTLLKPGDRLLVGHHRGDQLETRLMRALQRRPPRGMPSQRALGLGMLWRPLLDQPKPRVDADAIDDPANYDRTYRRVQVRQDLLPKLAPELVRQTERVGRLVERLDRLMGAALPAGPQLAVGIASAATIAAWCWREGQLPGPPRRQIDSLLLQLPPAPDRQPMIEWAALGRRWRIRAYAGQLWLLPAAVDWPPLKAGWRTLEPGQGARLHALGIPPWERAGLCQDAAGRICGWRPIIRPVGHISLEELRLND